MTVETGVLLVDDHRIVLEGLSLLIDRQEGLRVCGAANDARAALAAIESSDPRVVIVDIALGHDDGLDLIKVIHSRWPEIKILALSMHSEAMFAERALRAGAAGYLRKDDAPERFVDALRAVLQGRIHVSAEIEEQIFRRVVGRAADDGRMPTESLSDRELTVLRLMGSGRTTREIASDLNLSIKTVQTHQEHLKSKLAVGSAVALTRYAVLWVEAESRG